MASQKTQSFILLFLLQTRPTGCCNFVSPIMTMEISHRLTYINSKSLLCGRGRIFIDCLKALLVLTELFCQRPLRLQYKCQLRSPWLGICLGVLNREVFH